MERQVHLSPIADLMQGSHQHNCVYSNVYGNQTPPPYEYTCVSESSSLIGDTLSLTDSSVTYERQFYRIFRSWPFERSLIGLCSTVNEVTADVYSKDKAFA